MSEPPSFHDKCDSSHSTAASSHESDPAHSDYSCHNSDEDSKRQILVPPNKDARGALHHNDNNHHRTDSGEKASQPNQHLIKNSEARSERPVHQHNKNIHIHIHFDVAQEEAQQEDDGGGHRDLPQHDPENSPLRHDHRHQSYVQQIFSPPRPSHVSQNSTKGELSSRRFFESHELQASGARNMGSDVLVQVSKPSSQHTFMEQQDTYQKEAYKFETPPLDDTLDDAEKERRRRALAQEQQQMILQQVQAAREANKKGPSRVSDKKPSSSSSSSYHASSHNVIHNKRAAPTTSSSTRNANTPAINYMITPTAIEATTAKSITLPPRHPILTKSPNPRTKGKLYQRLPDGTVVKALSNCQPQHACNVSNETVSCKGVWKKEILEEEDTRGDEEVENDPVLQNQLVAADTPKTNAWHRG
jgi:hypothetical protein